MSGWQDGRFGLEGAGHSSGMVAAAVSVILPRMERWFVLARRNQEEIAAR